jgi:hypothetical protein
MIASYSYINDLKLYCSLGNVFNLYEALPENVEGDARSKNAGYQESNEGHKTTGNVLRNSFI